MENMMETTIELRGKGLEGMENRMTTTRLGYIGATTGIWSFIPNYPRVSFRLPDPGSIGL